MCGKRHGRGGPHVASVPDIAARSIDEMPHLHLPADHDEHDRELAAALARVLRSSELYVTWRGSEPARPVETTACDEQPRRRRGLKRLFRRTA